MDLENKCSDPASVEDNEETKNVPVLEKLENAGESKVEIDGSCEVENSDSNELLPVAKGEEAEASVSVDSHPVEMKSEVSPSPESTRKGYGLKKWRRIKRDVIRGGGSSEDTGKMLKVHELSNLVMNPSKRTQAYPERQQKSEGSVSSPNPMVGNFDAFALIGESGFSMGPSVDAGTDSENSEDHSSKSSTAASVPKIKYEIPVVVGFPHDKIKMRYLSGKNLTHSVQRGQQGKGRVEATKKARGERVKIEKENSSSSMESDLRSSDFVFMQGTYPTSYGIRSEGHENGHGEVRVSEGQFGKGLRGGYSRDNEGGYEDSSTGDLAADLSCDAKKERSENHGSSSDLDPLVESIFSLQKAQEALEEEVLKFKEIGKDASVDGSLSDTQPDFTDLENKSFEQSPCGEGVLNFSRTLQYEVLEIAKRDVEAALEDLFKQRIEAELEYFAISRTVQKLRVASVDQSIVLEEQKSTASELTENQLGDMATMLKKDAEKLQNLSEDIASVDDTLKLQKRVCKYTIFFRAAIIVVNFFLLLLIIIGVFIFQLSPNYVEIVPT